MSRPAMRRAYENLSVTIEEWTPDGMHIVEVMGRMCNVVLAKRALDAARGLRPTGRILVRHGALVLDDSGDPKTT